MLRVAPFVLSLLLATPVRADAPISPAAPSLQAMFQAISGQHVKLVGGRGILDLAVDSVGADHFCGRTDRATYCVPFTSVLYLERVRPGQDRVHVRADAFPDR